MLRRAINFAASSLDQAIAGRLIHRSMAGRSTTNALGHEDRMRLIRLFLADYDVEQHYRSVGSEGAFFIAPDRIEPKLSRVRAMDGGGVFDATWPSEYEVFAPAIAERYESTRENRIAGARLFLHDEPRPAIILIHGYRCGQYPFEERVWPINAFYSRGMDVILAVLPFHAVRGDGRPRFPSSDPRFTVEGFRQAAFDLMGLVSFLVARGSSAIGVMGMSLGGYTTALMATLDARLRFAIPMMPLASLADLARTGGRFVGTEEEQAIQHEAVDRLHRVASPTARPPVIPSDGGLVLAFEGDRITPVDQAKRIAEHLRAPLEVFAGGHILQADRASAFRSALRHVGRLGLLSSR